MAKTRNRHSFPAWGFGPQTFHPKFGGGSVIGGIEKVSKRLMQIHSLGGDILSSGHVGLEIADPLGRALNAPNAISYETLYKGIRADRYPMWSAITAPAFGIRGASASTMAA